MWSSTVGAVPVVTSATPAVCTVLSSPTWTIATTPGGPPGMATNSASARSRSADNAPDPAGAGFVPADDGVTDGLVDDTATDEDAADVVDADSELALVHPASTTADAAITTIKLAAPASVHCSSPSIPR